MYISTDRPSPISWSISGTGATFATSSSFLNDGKVALPTRCTWTTGTQTTSTTMSIIGSWSSPIVSCQVFALLCPKTAYAPPVGTPVSVTFTGSGTTATGTLQQFADGSHGLIIFLNTPAANVTGVTVTFTNNIGGSTVFTAGQNLDFGEIWIGSALGYKIDNNIADGLVDPTTNRRSHSNEVWPLFLKPYDTLNISFTPMVDSVAYDPTSSTSFKQMRYNLSTALSALVLPRVFKPGSTTSQDAVALQQLTIFGRPDKIDDLTRNGDQYWTAKLQFSQAPP